MKIYLNEKVKTKNKHLMLSHSTWDDYSYRSTFEFRFFDGKKYIEIGELKIIDNTKDLGNVDFESGISFLEDKFCSLGQSKDYYLSIRELGHEDEHEILKILNDCAYDEVIYREFSGLDQFKSSAVRFSTAEQVLSFAQDIYSRNNETKMTPCHSFKFNTKLRGFDSEYKLNFKFFNQHESEIPSNINVIIGRNGTGKTQLLNDLAKTISGYGFEGKEELIKARDSKFVNGSPKFGRVIVVSYSAFDNFEIPGKNESEIKEMQSQGHIYGYKYCGLRERMSDNEYRLRNIEEISSEFKTAIGNLRSSNRIDDWTSCIQHVISDPSFRHLKKEQLQKTFSHLSSGQKIILSILTSIFDHIEDNSIVIIDEPETHLHPSLISAFMHSLRSILSLSNSYAIIATHSPVILQETPSKFVQVLKGSVKRPKTSSLSCESFGEEISTLTEEVFKVSFEESNFYNVLSGLSDKGYTDEKIEKIFGNRLGITARSFLRSGK